MKRVLVTGSSRGIGRAIAVRLAEEKFDVVLHCRSNLSKAQEVEKEIADLGQDCKILQFDISNREQCNEIISKDIEENGVYFGVVCNAGIARDNPFPALEGDEWDDVIHTNLDGFYNVLKPVIMPMIQSKQEGRIVTLSSVSGIAGNRGQVNYSAAKAGIIGATKALAVELAKRKITVNCIAPGLIETEMIESAPVEEIIKHIPARRLGQPKEVAALAAFLFSDEASYITKQVISINGGIV
ncbi:MAG: 3-oxoacyl-ACP reductase FabG [Spirochaetia bacterium]|nr:3-oxoacyl-ACP reductase FabG [Spirochaetia bacterium]